jgi:hypothetical protein
MAARGPGRRGRQLHQRQWQQRDIQQPRSHWKRQRFDGDERIVQWNPGTGNAGRAGWHRDQQSDRQRAGHDGPQNGFLSGVHSGFDDRFDRLFDRSFDRLFGGELAGWERQRTASNEVSRQQRGDHTIAS